MSAVHVDGYDDVPDAVLYAGEPPREIHPAECLDMAEPTIPASFSDAHVAEALADHLRGRWLFVAAWSRWLWWDGTRWATDQTEGVQEAARRWAIDLVGAVALAGASDDDVKRAAAYRNRAKLDAALMMARRVDGIAASPGEFDQDPDLLNVANGVVNLRTGDLLAHDPALRLTKLAPVAYMPGAYHRDAGAVLDVVDRAAIGWVKRLVGYAATGHTSEDVVAVLDGSGANGKSSLLEGFGAVLGDYAGAVSPQLVMRTSHDPHPTIKADLVGRRLVWISETEEGGSFRMEQVKALTGGDQISARFMRGDFFTFTPTHTLVIATNHRPAVNSTEHAAWRRLRLIRFPHTYRPAHEAGPGDRVQDPGLRHRLVTGEAQREALLAWIIEGAVDWYRDGLGTCDAIDAAGREWRQAEDVVLRFITDRLEFEDSGLTRGRDLYTAYTDWCAAEGRKAKSNKNFTAEFLDHEAVKEAEVTKVSPQGQAHYRGVSIRAGIDF